MTRHRSSVTGYNYDLSQMTSHLWSVLIWWVTLTHHRWPVTDARHVSKRSRWPTWRPVMVAAKEDDDNQWRWSARWRTTRMRTSGRMVAVPGVVRQSFFVTHMYQDSGKASSTPIARPLVMTTEARLTMVSQWSVIQGRRPFVLSTSHHGPKRVVEG